jgi:glycosyltransferase involved in cell wall biosynthesis
LLRACLDGVLGQTDVSLDVIVVDDGSTDGTAAMVSQLGDPRISLIRHDVPKGGGVARNAGAAAATGRWLAFSDDDDLWAPTKLLRQIEAGEASGAVLVYCGAIVFTAEGFVQPDRFVPSPEEFRARVRRSNPLPGGGSAPIVKRDAFNSVGGCDELLHALWDWDAWIRLGDLGAVAAVDEPLVGYRMHDGNMTLDNAAAFLRELDYLSAKHRRTTNGRRSEIDRVGFCHYLANRQLLAGRRWRSARMHLDAGLRYRDLGHLGCAVRAPLGGWALGLRQPRPLPEAAPPWLEDLRRPSPADHHGGSDLGVARGGEPATAALTCLSQTSNLEE